MVFGDPTLTGTRMHVEQNLGGQNHGIITSKLHEIGVPSGYVKIAIENGHRNSGFSH